MRQWLREQWQKVAAQPCEACGEQVVVSAYRETGRTREGSWWSSGAVELECPNCGATFWAKK